MQPRDGPSVQLRVYDLSMGMARVLSRSMIGKQIDGIWHTGIVVFNHEYFYSGGIQRKQLSYMQYAVAPLLIVRKSMSMSPVKVEELGSTSQTEADLDAFLNRIGSRFTAEAYDLFSHNCNNFSDEVSQFLTGHSIPSYITGLPMEVKNSPLYPIIEPLLQRLGGDDSWSTFIPLLPLQKASNRAQTASLQPVPVVRLPVSSPSISQTEAMPTSGDPSVAIAPLASRRLAQDSLKCFNYSEDLFEIADILLVSVIPQIPSAHAAEVAQSIPRLISELGMIPFTFRMSPESISVLDTLYRRSPDDLKILTLLRLAFLQSGTESLAWILRDRIQHLFLLGPQKQALDAYLLDYAIITNSFIGESCLSTLLECETTINAIVIRDLNSSVPDVMRVMLAFLDNYVRVMLVQESENELSDIATQVICSVMTLQVEFGTLLSIVDTIVGRGGQMATRLVENLGGAVVIQGWLSHSC